MCSSRDLQLRCRELFDAWRMRRQNDLLDSSTYLTWRVCQYGVGHSVYCKLGDRVSRERQFSSWLYRFFARSNFTDVVVFLERDTVAEGRLIKCDSFFRLSANSVTFENTWIYYWGTTLSDLSSPPFISRQPPRALPLLWPRYVHLSDYRLHYALFVRRSTYACINTRYLHTYVPAPPKIAVRDVTQATGNCATLFISRLYKLKIKMHEEFIRRCLSQACFGRASLW
ncbi:hypothetical protein PUN28_008482 [Cardiocondyla obscurior]|uniref:Uncharacterized protein n=1 Tax=Cardiocondyla obscurior TaxID=286306 RepID=A0AAW2FXY6_9HYME